MMSKLPVNLNGGRFHLFLFFLFIRHDLCICLLDMTISVEILTENREKEKRSMFTVEIGVSWPFHSTANQSADDSVLRTNRHVIWFE